MLDCHNRLNRQFSTYRFLDQRTPVHADAEVDGDQGFNREANIIKNYSTKNYNIL